MPALITVAVTRFNLTASVSAFRRSVAAFLNAFCSIQQHACNVLHGCTCGKTSHSGPRGCTTVLRDKPVFCLCGYCLRRKCLRTRHGSRDEAACVVRAAVDGLSERRNPNRAFAATCIAYRQAQQSRPCANTREQWKVAKMPGPTKWPRYWSELLCLAWAYLPRRVQFDL